MLIPILTFFLGVFLAPIVRPLLRPLFIEVVRATLMTADEVRRLSAEVRENLEDATAEARAQHTARAADAPAAQAPPPDSVNG